MAISIQFDENDAPAMTKAVRALLAINLTILFLQWTLVNDADAFRWLGFQAGNVQQTLWTTGTYMFVHYSIWHLAVNMYALAVFGPRLEAAMGTRAFVLYYLWCGAGGALAHLFVHSGILVGSSAAVLGVMFASWQQWPREEVALFGVIPMRSWVLFAVLAAAMIGIGTLDAGEAAAGGSRLAYIAHLGGLAFGWLYFRTPPTVSLDRLRQRISLAPDIPDDAAPPRAIPRTLPRTRATRDEVDEVVAKSKAVIAPKRPSGRAVVTPVRTPKEARAAELNRVLDKISSSGLESLSSDEKGLLEEIAKGMRGEA